VPLSFLFTKRSLWLNPNGEQFSLHFPQASVLFPNIHALSKESKMLPIQVLSIVAAFVAGTSGHSLQSRAVGSPKFAKSTFNDISVGKEPDVAKVFDAVSVGCTGFIRDGKACDPGNDVNAQIAEDPAGTLPFF
jgi:hypothetical protein